MHARRLRTGALWAILTLAGSAYAYLQLFGPSADSDPELKGTWQVSEMKRGGVPLPGSSGVAMTFSGGLLRTEPGRSRAYRSDAAATPRRIDIVNADESEAGMWRGVYEVRGDALRIHLRVGPGQGLDDRPADLEVSNRPDFLLMTLIRKRP